MTHSCPLSPVLGGEGWGEGPGVEKRKLREGFRRPNLGDRGRQFAAWPLTPTLSPEYRGEGAGSRLRQRIGLRSRRGFSFKRRQRPTFMLDFIGKLKCRRIGGISAFVLLGFL